MPADVSYVQCPRCRAVFRIGAAVLESAAGQARCGSCASVFDATAHLRDEAFMNAARAAATYPPVAAPRPNDEIPEVLRADIERLAALRGARRRAVTYTLASLVLLAGLALQGAWFEPGEIGRRYPLARSTLETFCAHARCTLPEQRDPSAVRVLSRDVRVHPRYEGALRITATLVNTASYRQPFPRIRFNLFNVNGQTIATRVFSPEQYLDPRSVGDGEMGLGGPVQITLEVLAPEEAAVSFEFQFL